ncbi:MAG: glycosyltransferase family 2 protein [Desulfosarcina sp.]|jgi:glycosyltransferase involved in cell wall biosynthesis
MTTPLSIAIIAKDEADRIATCIDSLGFADEIVVVVDERSRDDTLSIVRNAGCRAIQQKWLGYAKQKQLAVDSCSHPWVLIVDADERVPPQTAEAIQGLLDVPDPSVAAYSLTRKNILHGQWIRRCGWWPDRVIRLVDRTKGAYSEDLVHEQWVAEGPVQAIDHALEHHSFRNYADMLDKLQHYSTLAARQMHREGHSATWLTPMSHGLWMFVRTYFLELGMLAGFDGFMISILNAGGSFMKYAKLRELRLADGSSRPTSA